jgi:hypothetical protein
VRKGDDRTTFVVPKVNKIRRLNLPEHLGPPRPVAGHLHLFIPVYIKFSFTGSAEVGIRNKISPPAVGVSSVKTRVYCDCCDSERLKLLDEQNERNEFRRQYLYDKVFSFS